MKDDSHPREAILKHAKVITIRLTTLFWLCLIASLCDFPNVCLSDYRVVCRSLCVTVHRLLFIFFVLLTAQLTYWLTVLLSLCVTWYLSVFVLLQILNVLTVVKWHSLPLIVSYLVSFRLLLRILTGCHLLMHSKFILWNDLFLPRPPTPPFRGLRRVERWRVKARLVTKCCEWSPQHSVMSFTWKWQILPGCWVSATLHSGRPLRFKFFLVQHSGSLTD